MKNLRSVASAVVLFMVAALGWAQSVPARPKYTLVPDDVINVTVFDFPELSVQTTVLPDGTVTVPLLQDVPAAGRTPGDLAADLQKRWSKMVVDPRVTVSVVQRHRRFVTIEGQVTKPGPVEFRQDMRVLEAIADAGGVLTLSDMSRVELVGADGTHRTVDLTHPEDKAGTDGDPVLLPDDEVMVPEAARINVIGKVNTPGPVVFKAGLSVLDALQAAGGVRDDADLSGATIQRGSDKLPVDLDALLRLGDIDFNDKLQPGDTLFVPEARNRVYIFGAVNRPGFYFVKPKDRILDALNAAGGLTPDSDAKVVRFIHAATATAPSSKEVLNLDDLFRKGDVSKNIPVEPGDVIYVSFKRRTLGWSDLFSILGSLSIIFTGGGGRLFS